MNHEVERNLRLHRPFLASIGWYGYINIGPFEYLFELKNGEFCVYDDLTNETFRLNPDRQNMTNREVTKEFSRRLRRMVQLQCITQCELASKLGVSQPTVSQYVRGNTKPSYENIRKLCFILDCEPSDFTYDKAFRDFDRYKKLRNDDSFE